MLQTETQRKNADIKSLDFRQSTIMLLILSCFCVCFTHFMCWTS